MRRRHRRIDQKGGVDPRLGINGSEEVDPIDSLTPKFDPAFAGAERLMAQYLESLAYPTPPSSFGDPIISDLSHIPVLMLSLRESLVPASLAIAADSEVAQLLETRGGQQAFINELSSGSRVDTNPGDLALQFLSAAVKWEYLFGRPISAAGLRKRLNENLTHLRAGLKGARVPTFRIIGYAGLPLEAGASIDTAWGRVIPSPKPSLAATIAAASGGRGILGASALLLIESSFDLVISWEALPPLLAQDEVPDSVFTLLPLAFLLATESQDRVAPTLLWMAGLQRVLGLGFGMGTYQFGPVLTRRNTPLTSDEGAAAAQWSSLISGNHNRNIDVAVRRCLSSAALRLDPADRLMDAVIAWENLFGASPETSFRLAAAIAKLLADKDGRVDLLKTLRDLYRRRSEVAHGANLQTISEDADAALDVAVRCLRLLYRDRVDLLSLAKSDQRANQLLLMDP